MSDPALAAPGAGPAGDAGSRDAAGSPAAGRAPGARHAPAGGHAPGGPRSRLAGRWRRWRVAAGVVGAALLVGVVTVAVAGSPGAGALDPRSAEPAGSRAVAEVLADAGVQVRREQRAAAAAAAAGPGSTVLVVDSALLAPRQLRRLAATGADLVLVQPDGAALDALGVDLAPAGTAPAEVVAAGCALPAAAAADRASGGGQRLRTTGEGATVCFPGTGGDQDGEPVGAYAAADLGSGATLRVLGQPAVLQNDGVTTAGNAALALHTLGARARLVWLMASPLDAGTQQPTPTSLLPRWVLPVGVQAGVVVLLLALWRGRRLGRLVTEPLPVVVRSVETAEGRAALYRRARATARCAAVLRAAALQRLAARLGLAVGAPGSEVADAAAAAAGADPAAVRALLLGTSSGTSGSTATSSSTATGSGAPDPGERGLVRLADDLDALEAAVARSDAAAPGGGTLPAGTASGRARPASRQDQRTASEGTDHA